MRLSDFWRLMDDEFGAAYSRVLAADLVMQELDGHTATQALDVGYDPRDVWIAVCNQQEVPPARRLGKDTAPKG